MKYTLKIWILVICSILLIACRKHNNIKKQANGEKLFSLVSNSKTNIFFKNTIKGETFDFNVLNYYYAYNGGGVAIGDIDNDGLEDVYITSNQKTNKLYINRGNFKFEDITKKAKVTDAKGWTTGVNMIDINNDGWLDIYVCKSASLKNEYLRRNKLFVNQKDGTFKEEAKKWGLDNNGLSIQSYFFDYDNDGDLDMYLINHRQDFLNSNNLSKIKKDDVAGKFFLETSDHLFRNDGKKFTDVTISSGILNGEYSLSASIGDFNNDGWLDVYVANDFITPDKLYINNKNGTFTNQINARLGHTSYSSMGSDFADINNDFLPDLLVLDMSAADHSRGKQNMPSMNTQGFWMIANAGYHYTYMSNMLNLNNGNGTFSDVAQVSGISKTDWSWASLIADFDNDGYKDIFIANGIKRELGNQDFGVFLDTQGEAIKKMSINEILNKMPSEKLKNYTFKNNRDLTFTEVASKWGMEKVVNSNGVAYGDLDNDGDLDLVINNLEDEASIYRNNSVKNYINIKLVGDQKNRNAIGSKVKVYTDSLSQYQELFLSRGYQSSVSPMLNFGLGEEAEVKRIDIIWPDGKTHTVKNIKANQVLTFNKKKLKVNKLKEEKQSGKFLRVDPLELGIGFKHSENSFNDFSSQVLLPQKQSHQGPVIEVADVNNDGKEDLFLGGALNQASEIYIQNSNGTFSKIKQTDFERDKLHEDLGAHFFDADNDGDLDLYVASGGYELDAKSPLLQDRLYLNNGKGRFKKQIKLPKILSNTKSVKSLDYDNDGDLDLFVAGRVVPGKYPLPSKSYILENKNHKFVEVTSKVAPEFSKIGLVNEIIFSDYDNDKDNDLIIVGEWMPITIFNNSEGKFAKDSISAFNKTDGWWNTISEIDFDKDGDMDYFVGNLGSNNKFHPSTKKPLHIYGNNFDSDNNYDMILSKEYKGNLVPIRGKECSTQQNAFVSQKIPSYKEFANSTLIDIYGDKSLQDAYHKEVYQFKSLYIENKGGKNFSLNYLPTIAQLGPTMSFEFDDVNDDGNIDVLGIGAIHETEVETVRYDGNVGYILLGDSKGAIKSFKDFSFYNNKNAKNIKKINILGKTHFFITNNNAKLLIYKTKD